MAKEFMYGSQTEQQYKDLLAANQRKRAAKAAAGAVDLNKGLPFEVVNLNKATPAQAAEYEKLSGTKVNLPKTGGITPPPTLTLPLAPSIKPIEAKTEILPISEEVKNRALGVGEEKPETPEEKMIADLTAKMTAYTTGTTLTEEKERLEKEKGVAGMKTVVGSFEDEVIKTQNLLDSLESDITSRTKDYLVSESQRSRLYAAEQEPLMKSLGIAERGLTGATGRLERTQTDILAELGLIEKEKTAPLDLLEREVNIRSKIKDLTEKEIPGVVSSQFNDDGDLTIVTQDPATGKFGTQTIKGIGEKANQYQQITSQTDNYGNTTIIGVRKDGITEKLGTFKGIGPAKETVPVPSGGGIVTPENQTTILRDKISALPAGQQESAFGAIASFKNARDITSLLDKGVGTGPIEGRLQKLGQLTGKSSSDFNQFVAASTAFTANYIKALSGVQVSDKERQFLLAALPSPYNQENVNRDNLVQLLNFLKNKYELTLGIKFSDFPDEIPIVSDSVGEGTDISNLNFKF